MNNILFVNTATEAWEIWYDRLTDLQKEGFIQSSRAGNVVGETLNAVTVINDPTRGIVESPKRNMPIRYAVGELLWYLSGSNSLADIRQYSKFWENISDNGITLNSAYGDRIKYKFGFDQWEY